MICGVALDEFRDLGLGIEIHAGEFAGADSIRDALQCGRPHRLGDAMPRSPTMLLADRRA
jgi:hypothetical protein